MTAKDIDVLVVGELNADLILLGDVTPEFGQKEKLIDDASLTLGSSSGIFACGAARLGLRVAFVGKIGDDEFGRFVRGQLEARGVDTAGLVVDSTVKTGLSVILSRGSNRAILTHLGSIAALRYSEVSRDLVARARHMHLGGSFACGGSPTCGCERPVAGCGVRIRHSENRRASVKSCLSFH